MSWFGHGTFKQQVLEEIESRAEDHGLTLAEATAEVAEVLSHLCSTAFTRDKALEAVKSEAKEEAKRELIGKITAA